MKYILIYKVSWAIDMPKILVGVNAYPKQPFISHKPLIAVLNEAAIEAENDAAIAAAFCGANGGERTAAIQPPGSAPL